MKKKTLYKAAFIFVCIAAMGCFTLLQSTTKQAINYQNQEFKIPLYLKTIDFVDRHLNYRWTVQQIISKEMKDTDKVKAIYQWTIRRIARQPDQLPVIDDHVWHIIVRGYGVPDQMADVFATLSNYAGQRAFILNLNGPQRTYPRKICLGAVFYEGSWHICDPYQRTEFVNKMGRWATISEIAADNWRIETGNDKSDCKKTSLDYQTYFLALNTIDFEALFHGSRSSIQNPINRFLHFFRDRKNEKHP